MPDLALDVKAKALHLLHTLSISSCDRLLKGKQDSTRENPVDLGSDANDVLGTATSLCDLWWTGNALEGKVVESPAALKKASDTAQDLPPRYSMMLSVEVFALYHHYVEAGSIDVSSTETVQDQTPIVVVQILAKIISSQNEDGSWGPQNSVDATTYALLTLITIVNLPYLQVLSVEAQYAIEKGRQALFLMRDLWTKPSYPFFGTDGAEPSVILEAYSLAAMKKALVEHSPSEKTLLTADKQTQQVLELSRYFSSLQYMKKQSFPMIKATILEGIFYIPLLKSRRNEIFPATNAKEKDRYFNYIPPLWLFTSTLDRIFLPPDMMFDMMIRSMLIFLVDEYMESNVTEFSQDELQSLKAFIESIHPENDSSRANPRIPGFLQGEDISNNTSAAKSTSLKGSDRLATHQESDRLKTAISVFRNFAIRVMDWPHARNAASSDLLELRSEMKWYLLYHIVQIEDNIRFVTQSDHKSGEHVKFSTPRTSHHVWAHTIGSGHVSGPFSFAFAVCCIGGGVRGGKDCFKGVRQKLNAYNMNAHIGAYCRLYNDYGSITRDREERNLNSINFPEFFSGNEQDDAKLDADQDIGARAKAMLREAAEYERKCAIESAKPLLRELDAEPSEGTMVANSLRVWVSSLYPLFPDSDL